MTQPRLEGNTVLFYLGRSDFHMNNNLSIAVYTYAYVYITFSRCDIADNVCYTVQLI